MSFGTAVEVLAPESLRDEIRENAEKILEKYKK
ncbi:MAG: WYL domain-containing protein [Spirochaetia bacterium]|nr:WYL domain-containing protein [Spirochaetia bacterium]